MRVKAGNNWYECEPGQPIMVELTKQDKENIGAMPPDASCYAAFVVSDGLTIDEMLAWMYGGRDVSGKMVLLDGEEE